MYITDPTCRPRSTTRSRRSSCGRVGRRATTRRPRAGLQQIRWRKGPRWVTVEVQCSNDRRCRRSSRGWPALRIASPRTRFAPACCKTSISRHSTEVSTRAKRIKRRILHSCPKNLTQAGFPAPPSRALLMLPRRLAQPSHRSLHAHLGWMTR